MFRVFPPAPSVFIPPPAWLPVFQLVFSRHMCCGAAATACVTVLMPPVLRGEEGFINMHCHCVCVCACACSILRTKILVTKLVGDGQGSGLGGWVIHYTFESPHKDRSISAGPGSCWGLGVAEPLASMRGLLRLWARPKRSFPAPKSSTVCSKNSGARSGEDRLVAAAPAARGSRLAAVICA